MKTCFLSLLLFIFLGQGTIYSQQNQLQLKSSATAPLIDGIIDKDEWVDAQEIKLQRTADWQVNILVKYDSNNLYVAFQNLSNPQLTRLNSEILIQTIVNENNWDENCFWFHSSYSICYSQGNYYNWEHCSNDSPGWKANTFPFTEGNNNMEFKIRFSKLQIDQPNPGMKLRVAFKLSSADESHTYWPHEADIQYPDSWGKLVFK